MNEYQPHELGMVAMVKNQHGVWNRAILTLTAGGYAWRPGCSDTFYHPNCEVRPLVVIDPEDADQVTRLMAVYAGSPLTDNEVPEMQQALRRLANPVPPEPAGDRPIVLDKEGDVWQKRNSGWMNTYGGAVSTWSGLNDRYGPVTVLPKGLTPEAQS